MVLAAAALLLTGGLAASVAKTQTSFSKIFRDFGVELPALTVLVQSPWFLGVLTVLFATTALKELLVKDAPTKAIWNGLAILSALVLGGLYLVGVFGPLICLIDKLS